MPSDHSQYLAMVTRERNQNDPKCVYKYILIACWLDNVHWKAHHESLKARKVCKRHGRAPAPKGIHNSWINWSNLPVVGKGYSDGKTMINHPSNNHHKWVVSTIKKRGGLFLFYVHCTLLFGHAHASTAPQRQQLPKGDVGGGMLIIWAQQWSETICCWPFDCSHKQQIDKASPQARLTTEINQVEKNRQGTALSPRIGKCLGSRTFLYISETFWIIFMLPYVKGHVQARHCPTSPSGRLEARLDSVKCSHGCRFKGRLRAHWMLQALNRRGFHIWLWGWSCSKVQRSLLCLDGILLLPSALRAHL